MKIMINNIAWQIKFNTRQNTNLQDYDGNYRLGMTDNNTKTIYLDQTLNDRELYSVLCHELVHAFCFSYEIYLTVEEEERLASFIEHFGSDILNATDRIFHEVK